MESREAMDLLAQRLAAATHAESSPPLLFLGHGCSRAAGVPSIDDVVEQMAASLRGEVDLPQLKVQAEHLALSDQPSPDRGTLEEISAVSDLGAFLHERLVALPNAQRARLLLQIYDAIPVPLFYQDLTSLLWAGYFTEILTTNVDTLLEQALNLSGFRPDYNYSVISLGSERRRPEPWEPEGGAPRFVRIFKLHGDLAQQEVVVTPEEIAAALEPQRMLVKGELRGDIVMVGYEFESAPINQWLTFTSGDVWWVSTESPDPAMTAPIAAARTIHQITGAAGSPTEFFGILEGLLLSEADAVSLGLEAVEPIASPVLSSAALDPAAVLRTRISRSQSVLSGLEQQVAPSERAVPMQKQIDYQRGQIVELEDRLRGLSGNASRVTELVQEMAAAAEQAGVDEGTLDYLRSQLSALKREQANAAPNQHVVSAAISGTIVLAERLGSEVVGPELVEELASFVPSVTAWRS